MVTHANATTATDSAKPLDVTFSAGEDTRGMLSTVLQRQDALRDQVQHLTYLMARLLSEHERNRTPTEFVDKPAEYHLYFKCSRDEALKVFGRALNMAAELDGDLFN